MRPAGRFLAGERRSFLVPLLAGVLSGCAGQSYLVLLDSPDGRPSAVVVSTQAGETTLDQSGGALALAPSGARAIEVSPARFERDFSASTAAQPPEPDNFILYFETGGTRLTLASEALLNDILSSVRNRPAPDISVTGHTDTVGDESTNEGLARERARFVANWLADQPDLSAVDLTIASHGERNLLVHTADNVDEPRNRRVEVTVR